MWCGKCSQDVPAIASPDKKHQVVCARCGCDLSGANSPGASLYRFDVAHVAVDPQLQVERSQLASEPSPSQIPLADREMAECDVADCDVADCDVADCDVADCDVADCDVAEWEIDALQEVWDSDEHLMRAKVAVNSYRTIVENGQTVLERAFRNAPNTTGNDDAEFEPTSVAANDRRSPTPWFFAFPGITVIVFGGVLTCWSLLTGRADLWQVGLPALLAGQAVLMLGLMFQLERLRHSHRQTENALEHLQETTGRLTRESSIREQIDWV